MEIILFGAPGVGKGTQAKILSSKLHIPHISTGDILRTAISKKTALGLKAKAIMDLGNLVPDDIMGGIIKDALNDPKSKNGFILDGFPRTREQASILDNIFNELGIEKARLILITAEDELIIKRLSARRECSACGNIFNLNYLKDANKCPSCGSKNSFVKRKDDEVDIIKNRLKVFHETTEPVLEYYENKSDLLVVDGTLPVDEVTRKILDSFSVKK